MKYTFEDLKPVVGLTNEERETVITMDDTGTMRIYTNENPMITKLRKLCESNPENYKPVRVDMIDGRPTGYVVTAPRDLLTLRAATVKLELSEEQREERRERMKNALARKQ